MRRALALVAAVSALLVAGAAQARQVVYTAHLSGDAPTSSTGSHATGDARILVDTEARTVDVSLDVNGITLDGLWDTLVARPIGPIHLHLYGAHDHANPNTQVTLVFPVPFGTDYATTAVGFRVHQPPMTYAQGATLLGSSTTFEQFMASMDAGDVIVNVHTDAFHDGESSGVVTRAP